MGTAAPGAASGLQTLKESHPDGIMRSLSCNVAQASYATRLSAMAHTLCAMCSGAVKTHSPAMGHA